MRARTVQICAGAMMLEEDAAVSKYGVVAGAKANLWAAGMFT